jgi:hypothetical protein
LRSGDDSRGVSDPTAQELTHAAPGVRRRTLDSNSEFRAEKEGQIIRLRFAGTKIWEVTISGLNLWRCYDLIHQHRMPWVRKFDRGFANGSEKEALITDIPIKEIERVPV